MLKKIFAPFPNKTYDLTWYIFIALLLLSIASLGVYLHQHKIIEKEHEQSFQMLQGLTDKQVSLFQNKIENQFSILEIFSNMVSNIHTDKELFLNMDIVVNATELLHLFIVDSQGNARSNSNIQTNIADRGYFQESMRGHRSVARIPHGRIARMPRFILSVPLKKNGVITGIVYGSYDETLFKQLISEKAFKDQYTFIVDRNGKLIIGSDSNYYLLKGNHFFKEMEQSGNSIELLRKNFADGIPGVVTYSIGGQRRYASYRPILINDWIMFDVLPAKTVEAESKDIIQKGWILFGLIAIISFFFFAIIIFLERRNILRMHEEQRNEKLNAERTRIAIDSTSISIWDYEIRTKCIIQTPSSITAHGFQRIIEDVPDSLIRCGYVHPDSCNEFLAMYAELLAGKPKVEGVFQVRTVDGTGWWYEHIRYTTLFDESGKPYCAIGISDNVTDECKAKRSYERERMLYCIMDKNVINTVLLNISTKTLERIQYNQEYPVQQTEMNFQTFCRQSAECAVDAPKVRDFFLNLTQEVLEPRFIRGEHTIEFEYARCVSSNEPQHFVRSVCRLVREPVSKNLMAFFTLYDINDEHSKILALTCAAELDSMTRLYNHQMTFYKIEQVFSEKPEANHAIFIIDIDNFKLVNDIFGHQAGDDVIIFFATQLRQIFRSSDILGRLGGDEFLILMKNTKRPAVEKKCEQLTRQLRYVCSNSENTLNVSASIGVYLCNGEKPFSDVYDKADKSLYAVKKQGKNGYFIVDCEDVKDIV